MVPVRLYITKEPPCHHPDGGWPVKNDCTRHPGVTTGRFTGPASGWQRSVSGTLLAFYGYLKQRERILITGFETYEFNSDPAIHKDFIERYHRLKKAMSTFAIHAKTVVIEHEHLFAGTFNFYTRSTHLNTEARGLLRNRELAAEVETAIEKGILPADRGNTVTDATPPSPGQL
jgi:phosphatidylserine/phosphatidylglycerophosphate/cardiolipin synthase-like enzyme